MILLVPRRQLQVICFTFSVSVVSTGMIAAFVATCELPMDIQLPQPNGWKTQSHCSSQILAEAECQLQTSCCLLHYFMCMYIVCIVLY